MWTKGYWRVGTYRDAPLRVHWSLPLGLLVFGGLSLTGGLAFLALVALHEAGHASLIRQHGLRVLTVDLTALGGECRWLGDPPLRTKVFIAWGGVIAQLVAFAFVGALVLFLGEPSAPWLVDVVDVYLWSNLWMALLNLLPLPGLDGELALRVIPWYRRRARVRDQRFRRTYRLQRVQRPKRSRPAPVDETARAVDAQIREIVEAHHAQAEREADHPEDTTT